MQSVESHIWHPFSFRTDAAPLAVQSGQGPYLYTTDGTEILDAISSWWVNLHGHARPELNEAVAAQARLLEQVIFAGFTHEPAQQLVAGLLQVLPPHLQHFFFSDNGSTAVEVALKMLLQYYHNLGQPRNTFLAFESAYHGDTFGAMSVSSRGVFTRPFDRQLFDVAFLPDPDVTDTGTLLQALRAATEQHFVAGIIVEPLIMGAGGMKMYGPDKLEALVAESKKLSIPVIFDEVFVGFGRTGRLFAHQHITTQPDIICLSKGLTGGYLPMGLTVCTEEIRAAFRGDRTQAFLHGHSFTANPMACAVAVRSLQLLLEPACQQAIADICEWQAAARDHLATLPGVADARCTGTVLALTLQAPDGGYLSSIGPRVYDYCLHHRVLLRPMGPVLYVVPPYVCTQADLQKTYDVIEAGLHSHWTI